MSTTEPISRRDYFAANAPEKIPDWFEPTLPSVNSSLPPEPAMPADLQAKVEADTGMKGLSSSGGIPLALQKAEDVAKFQQYKAELDAWRNEVGRIRVGNARELEQYRYYAWRWHYADQMIKASKPPEDDVFKL